MMMMDFMKHEFQRKQRVDIFLRKGGVQRDPYYVPYRAPCGV
jgi:hypothetical protein